MTMMGADKIEITKEEADTMADLFCSLKKWVDGRVGAGHSRRDVLAAILRCGSAMTAFSSPNLAAAHERAIGILMKKEAESSARANSQFSVMRQYVGPSSKITIEKANAIIALLEKRPMTARELCAALGIKPRSATQTLVLLRHAGKVKSSDPVRSMYGAPRLWSVA